MSLIVNPKYKLPIEKGIKIILADKSNYIRIPEDDIAVGEKKQLTLTNFPVISNLNWEDFHKALSKYERGVPSSVDRLNLHILLSSGKPVYDGNKNQIRHDKLEEIKRVALTDCREHTSTRFSSGKNGLIVNHSHIIDENGTLRPLYSKPLEDCVMENRVIVELRSFNSQGFPTKKSEVAKYVKGGSIVYLCPAEGAVARFVVDTGRASLNCNWNPSYWGFLNRVGTDGYNVRAKSLEDI